MFVREAGWGRRLGRDWSCEEDTRERRGGDELWILVAKIERNDRNMVVDMKE